MRLPVAVHAPVALLEHHQRPGHVEVNQAVALEVQVDALGERLSEQSSRRTGRCVLPKSSTTRCCSMSLMVPWRISSWPARSFKSRASLALEPVQRLDAFGEDDEAVRGVVRLPAERLAAGDRGEQRPILCVVAGTDVVASAEFRRLPCSMTGRFDVSRQIMLTCRSTFAYWPVTVCNWAGYRRSAAESGGTSKLVTRVMEHEARILRALAAGLTGCTAKIAQTQQGS